MIALSSFVPAFAADVLFPRPLHIIRRVEDPIANSAATIHEYCAGDQIVTVNGSRIAIADYGRQVLTEIDRSAGTYSVTRFDELANAQASSPRLQMKGIEWKAAAKGVKGARNGRSLDTFELTRDGEEKMSIEIGVDRATRLSRNALEVLIGASYPNPRRNEHDAILGISRGGAAKTNAAGGDDYALPYEQSVTVEVEGTRVTMRNSVLEVRNELAPDELRLIPPGARRVESPTTRFARELRELDQLPSQQQPQQPH
ncbi:MAG TPA: hypothetical protein VNA69_07590 [Thermoanaerobaculia bacterium]|nr:hypothetical protein [Thermoanaerobaculia bacterium]